MNTILVFKYKGGDIVTTENRGKKKIFVAWCIAISVLISSIAAIFALTYDNARVVFSGITMRKGAGDTIQGFVDITVKDINIEGLTVNLHYDKRYIEPSSYTDNHVYTGANTLISDEVFKINSDIFADGTFFKYSDIEDQGGITDAIGSVGADGEPITSTDSGTIAIALITAHDVADSEYVKTTTDVDDVPHTEILANNFSGGLSLGQMSFRVNDPAGLSQLSAEQLKDVLYITSTKKTEDGAEVLVPDLSIVYYNPDSEYGDLRGSYTSTEYANFDWNIKADVISVAPIKESENVLAPKIYYSTGNTGTQQDLIDYANMYMNKIAVKYSDMSETVETITWGDTENDFTISPGEYNPKEGTYTLTQKYGNYTVSVEIISEPVKLTGFTADSNQLSETYPTTADVPVSDAELNLPAVAYGTTDREYDMTDVMVPIADTDWTHSPGDSELAVDDMSSGLYTDFVFTAVIDPTAMSLSTSYPWLTVDKENYQLTAYRYIGEQTGDPTGVVGTVNDEGKLIINVDSLGGAEIPAETTFKIYMPDGTVIDSADSGVEVNIEGGKATVTVTPSSLDNTDIRTAVQEMINIGSNNFGISATEPDKTESAVIDFEAYRNNYYTNSIMLDHSDSSSAYRSSLLPLNAGTSLDAISTYISFADYSPTGSEVYELTTTYDGVTGEDEGKLKAAKVESWVLYDAGAGGNIASAPSEQTVLPASGTTCYLVGKLKEYVYSEYGKVSVLDDKTVTLKITTAEAAEITEAATVTSEGVQYGPSQSYSYGDLTLHYSSDDTPSKTFTITNTGASVINGLNVHTNSSDFVIVQQPATSLTAGETSEFTIRTKHDLPAGTYTAAVTVGSNNTETLETFNISVDVIDTEAYMVRLKVNNSDWGTATLVNGISYAAGKTVSIQISPNKGYTFNGDFTTVPQSLSISKNNENGYYEFTITRNTDVTVNFEETPQSMMQLLDLRVYDNKDVELTPLKTGTTEADLKNTSFEPEVDEYWLHVRNATGMAKVSVKPKNMAVGENNITTTATLVQTVDGSATENTSSVTILYNSDTNWYNTDLFNLEALNGSNVLKITRTYTDENDTYSRTYILHIVRRPQVNVNFNYGNSPYGLIERDDTLTEEQRSAAKMNFSADYQFHDGAVPSGAENYLDAYYSPKAWGEEDESGYENLDKDPYAIFTYVGPNANFEDPGWTGDITNSVGETVPPEDITRTIEVKTYTKTLDTASDILDFYSSAETKTFVFSGKRDTTTMAIDKLSGLDIRPGVYEIKYTFTDSDGGISDFSRNLVVLSDAGNIRSRSDGSSLDALDYQTIYSYNKSTLAQKLILPANDWERVLVYRVMDVNMDTNINSADANKIKSSLTDSSVAPKNIYTPLSELNKGG